MEIFLCFAVGELMIDDVDKVESSLYHFGFVFLDAADLLGLGV